VSTDAEGNEYGFHGVFHGVPTPDHTVQTFEFEGVPGHVSLETMTLTKTDGSALVRTVSRTATVWSPPAWSAAYATPTSAWRRCSRRCEEKAECWSMTHRCPKVSTPGCRSSSAS
jgi:hypothetical protein